MRAFIIRPFGEKAGIDFDKVEAELDRAGARRGWSWKAAPPARSSRPGNIREDMFQLLLVSDIVVADISIDNANAYYELGIRHALKEKRTFLIRATGMATDVPFDLRTDRYLAYDPAAPGDTLEELCAGLKATLASERQDSPVFRVLPELREQDRSRFLPIPREFREEVEYAARVEDARQARAARAGSQGIAVGVRRPPAGRTRAVQRQGIRSRGRDPRRTPRGPTRSTERRTCCSARSTNGWAICRDPKKRFNAWSIIRDTSAKDRAEAWSLLGRNLKTRWRDGWKALAAREPAGAGAGFTAADAVVPRPTRRASGRISITSTPGSTRWRC